MVVAAIAVGERQAGSERNLGADDAVTAVEVLLHGEHVHRAALALGIASAAAGQLRHDALGIHAAGQHVAMIAIAGDDLIARLDRHLHADDYRLLADIEVAEAADQSHAVELSGLLLEPADQQHLAVGGKLLLLAELGNLPPDRPRTLAALWQAGPLICCWRRPLFSSGMGLARRRGPLFPIAEIAARRKRMGRSTRLLGCRAAGRRGSRGPSEGVRGYLTRRIRSRGSA